MKKLLSLLLVLGFWLLPLHAAQIQVFFGQNQTPLTPVASPGAGSYGSTQSVTLTDASAATILYTTDGSTPACPLTGTLYSTAISISVTTTLKAVGCNGADGGSVLTAVYTIGGATPTFVNRWTSTGGSPTVLTVAPATGDFFWVGVCAVTASFNAPTLNTGSLTADGTSANLGYTCGFYHQASASAGVTTVTSTTAIVVFAEDWSNVTLGTLDKLSTSFTTGSGAYHTDTQTTTNAKDIGAFIAWSNDGGAFSGFSCTGTGTWTVRTVNQGASGLCDQYVTSTGTYNTTGATTGGNFWNGTTVFYKAQ